MNPASVTNNVMQDLHCPECETYIEEHESSTCLFVWAVDLVMGAMWSYFDHHSLTTDEIIKRMRELNYEYEFESVPISPDWPKGAHLARFYNAHELCVDYAKTLELAVIRAAIKIVAERGRTF